MVPPDFQENGFAVLHGLIDSQTIASLIADFESQRLRAEGAHSLRNVHGSEAVQSVAALPAISKVSKDALGNRARLVRAIYFDKIPGSNWSVPWHQDLTIAVEEKHEVSGFGPWSRKGGVWHVQPPANILENMVTVRIHLDDCGPSNGPVRVKAKSHSYGRIPESDMESWAGEEVACVGAAGSALLMRPLLLHASSPSETPSHRRVLHLEYAGCDLPSPLRWYLDSHFPG